MIRCECVWYLPQCQLSAEPRYASSSDGLLSQQLQQRGFLSEGKNGRYRRRRLTLPLLHVAQQNLFRRKETNIIKQVVPPSLRLFRLVCQGSTIGFPILAVKWYHGDAMYILCEGMRRTNG